MFSTLEERMKSYKIARAGGGTGGHTYPIQSLIQYAETTPAFQGKVSRHFRFGTAESLEEKTAHQLQKKIKNLTFLPLVSGKWRREKNCSAFVKNIGDCCRLLWGICQSLYYLRKYQIDKVFCKGGYVALPVVFAAKLLGKEIYVHESDTRPGIVNRIASRLARVNFTGFPQVLP